MAFLALNNPGSYVGAGMNPDQLANSNLNAALGKGLNAANNGEFREVPLGQIATAIGIKAVLSFDDPVTTQSSGSGGQGSKVSNSPPQASSGVSNNPPQRSSGVSSNPPQGRPPNNQVGGSGALTEKGGLSFGGGVRLGGGGAPFGLSAVGTTTVNNQGYQTSGGFSTLGISANAGIKIGGGGVQLSGGIKRAQVGQGIVGPRVGTR